MQADGMTRSAFAEPLELRGRPLILARLGWSALAAAALLLFVISLPARYAQLDHPPVDVRTDLARAGLPADVYAAYLTALGCVASLVGLFVAVLIVRHRANDQIGLLASLYLVLSVASPPAMQAVVKEYPYLALPANLGEFLYVMLLVAFFFVFPDGRFVPRWSRGPVLSCATVFTLVFFLTGASVVDNPPGWMGLMIAGGSLAGIAAQIYRYRRVSGALQRQQTKWVVLGVSVALGMSIVFSFFGQLIPTIGRPETGYDLTSDTVLTLAFLFIPLTLGFAILRYRLWEIDVVVNRTVVYGALTAGLVGLYLLIVNGFEALVRVRGNLPPSLLATALVAVLFAPLRQRLQAGVNRLMYGERDDPYRVLTHLAERFGAAHAPESVLPTLAETVAHAMNSPYAAITLLHSDAPVPRPSPPAFRGTPLRLPLEYQGEAVGELLVAPRGPQEDFSAADRRLLETLARQIGPAAHAVRLTADLQLSRGRLVTAREEERRRLRRDLHDGLGPQLAALALKIETVRNRFAENQNLDAALVDLTERTQAAVSDIRRLVYALRPPALDELGLLAAIRQAAEQYSQPGDRSPQVTVDAPPSLPALPAAVEVAAYRIVQEALNNAVRHSAASTCRVRVSLESERDILRLEIADDGCGLPAQHRTGVGLVSMRERAEELGGRFSIEAPSSGGTIVKVELPCPPVPQQTSDGRG
jgi:signal transduction histidine kinase